MKNFFKKAFKSIAIDMGIVLVVIAGIVIFILIAPDQALADSYTPLQSVPGLTSSGAANDLGTYISNLYNFSIAFGAALAVLMLVIAGFQYASTDNFGKKTAGRDRMTGALLGLGLLLTSFLLLSTINKDLIDTNINIQTATSTASLSGLEVVEYTNTRYCVNRVSQGNNYFERETGQCFNSMEECIEGKSGPNTACRAKESTYTITGNSCEDCSVVPSSMIAPAGPGVDGRQSCYGQRDGAQCTMSSQIAENVIGMHEELLGNGIRGYVTEGFPPTRPHVNGSRSCHANGTCIDYDVVNAGPNEIAAVIQTAKKNGLRAVFETPNERLANDFETQYPDLSGSIKVLPRGDNAGQITGDHFSVYNAAGATSF